MPPSSRRLWLGRTAWLALPALALTGCGIGDYEKKMQESEVRVERYDEENKLLGEPLLLPPRKDNEGPPFDVFLRPPLGVANKDKTQPGELAYHYPASGGVCTDLYLTFGAAGDGRDKLERQLEAAFAVPPQNWQPVAIDHPFGRPDAAFDAVEFADPRAPANAPASVFAYVHQDAGQPAVAVVYRVLQANRAAAGDALKMSLQTYADHEDAGKARGAYGKPLQG